MKITTAVSLNRGYEARQVLALQQLSPPRVHPDDPLALRPRFHHHEIRGIIADAGPDCW